MSENWKTFYQRFQLYINATDVAGKTNIQKISPLLHVIGEQVMEVYNTFQWNLDPADDESTVEEKKML